VTDQTKLKIANHKGKMTKQNGKIINLIILLLFATFQIANAQTIGTIDPTPKPPKVATFQQPNIVKTNYGINQPKTPNIYNPNLSIQQRNQLLIQQATLQGQQRELQRKQIIQEALSEFDNPNENINYNFPSKATIKGTAYYRKAYNELLTMDKNNYSVKDITFKVENAYFENKLKKEAFDLTINEIGKFLLEKMDDFGYDKNDNVAKNFILFQFFADTLQIKKKDLKHLPIKYDFDDFMGKKDWSKMFVTKLLRTNTGQCNSMPRLYLILAEQINAEAFLSFSPHHTYIRFKDENEKWYNVELTNQMFTTETMILNSGFIKAEALQNGLFMRNLTKKEHFAHMLAELSNGYIHKYGYDEFALKMILKSLELYPNLMTAHMQLSNYNSFKFEYVCKQLGINPRNHTELQKIRNYPKVIALLKKVQKEYNVIDNLGYEFITEEQYKNWIISLQKEKGKQESKNIKKKFKLKLKTFND